MERLRSNAEKLSSTDVSIQENCLRYLINGSAEELVENLTTLLVSENQDTAEKALWVLMNLTLRAEHSHMLVEYGIVESLISFLKRSNHSLIILSSVPLRNLLHKDTCGEYLDNQKTFCHSGAIQNINKILTSRYPTPSNELIMALTSIIHSLCVSCLANLTANQDIRRILRSKYLVDGLSEMLKEKQFHSSQILEAISLLIANLCIDESIQKALENMRVPVSSAVHEELNNKEDMSDLDPTDSLGPSLSLSPSPIKAGIMRFSRSLSPHILKPLSLDDSPPPLVDEPNMCFRRGKILKEIIDTEQLVEKIFSNIDQVFRVNCEFLKKLRSLSYSPNKIDILEVAQSFQWLWDQSSTIPEYRYYINGFNRAMDLIHENRAKSPRFKEFLEKCQFSDQFDALERDAIEDALRRTRIVADQLNESKRKAENLAKALMLQDKVVGLSDGFMLGNGTRQLLKEGLMMESRQKKVSKYRYLLLFNDLLYVTKKKKNKYIVKKGMPLVDLKVLDVPSSDNVENSFRLLWSGRDDRNEKGIVICSSKIEEKDDWIKEIRDACNVVKKAHLQTMLKTASSPTRDNHNNPSIRVE
eukprot:gene16142-19207_t